MTHAASPADPAALPVPLPVRFFLDFVSTYSYFAAQRIDAVAARHGREVHWQVVSLPHVFRQAGTTSPLEQPLKLAHNRQDVARLVAISGLPFRRPEGTPDVQRARLLFHRLRRTDAGLAARFAHAAITLRFGQGVELDGTRALRQACAGLGVAAGDIEAACADEPDPQDRAALVAATEEALAAGMFGAPFAAVGTQCFWGQDRVTDHLDWWLTQQAAAPEPPHPAP